MQNNPVFKRFINRLFTDYDPNYIKNVLSLLLINVGFLNTPFTNLNAKNNLPNGNVSTFICRVAVMLDLQKLTYNIILIFRFGKGAISDRAEMT